MTRASCRATVKGEIVDPPIPTLFSTDMASRLKRRVRGYELRYRINSDELIRRLESGEMQETDGISRWVQALIVLRRCRQQKARTIPLLQQHNQQEQDSHN